MVIRNQFQKFKLRLGGHLPCRSRGFLKPYRGCPWIWLETIHGTRKPWDPLGRSQFLFCPLGFRGPLELVYSEQHLHRSVFAHWSLPRHWEHMEELAAWTRVDPVHPSFWFSENEFNVSGWVMCPALAKTRVWSPIVWTWLGIGKYGAYRITMGSAATLDKRHHLRSPPPPLNRKKKKVNLCLSGLWRTFKSCLFLFHLLSHL